MGAVNATLMVVSTGGTTARATVTASVSVRMRGLLLASTVVTVAVMLSTPLPTAVTSPVAGLKVQMAPAVSEAVKTGLGKFPVKTFPNWSNPMTEAVTVAPIAVRVTGPAVAAMEAPWNWILMRERWGWSSR